MQFMLDSVTNDVSKYMKDFSNNITVDFFNDLVSMIRKNFPSCKCSN